MKNLDRLIVDRDFDARLECSANWTELVAHLPAGSGRNARKFSRIGLGTWHAIALDFDDLGEVIAGAPVDEPDAGVSFWFGLSADVGFRSLASAVSRLFPDDPPMFMTPEGTPIATEGQPTTQQSDKDASLTTARADADDAEMVVKS